jgi:hypothetical protein
MMQMSCGWMMVVVEHVSQHKFDMDSVIAYMYCMRTPKAKNLLSTE